MFNIGNLSSSGGIGFLIGVLLVWWIQPTNSGGVGILIAISIVFCTVVGGNRVGITNKERGQVQRPA